MTKMNLAAIPDPKTDRLNAGGVHVGDYAPAFVLPRSDKRKIGSADLSGAPFILHFYSGSGKSWPLQSDCLIAIVPTLEILDVALVAVVCADQSQVRCSEADGNGFPILLDWEPRALVSRIYGFNRERASPQISATYVVDRRGVIRWVAFDGAKGRDDAPTIVNAVRLHLSCPLTVDLSD